MIRTFIVIYFITLIVLGLLCPILHKFGIGLGKLPGDVLIKKEKFVIYIPFVSSILLVVLLAFVLLLLGKMEF